MFLLKISDVQEGRDWRRFNIVSEIIERGPSACRTIYNWIFIKLLIGLFGDWNGEDLFHKLCLRPTFYRFLRPPQQRKLSPQKVKAVQCYFELVKMSNIFSPFLSIASTFHKKLRCRKFFGCFLAFPCTALDFPSTWSAILFYCSHYLISLIVVLRREIRLEIV